MAEQELPPVGRHPWWVLHILYPCGRVFVWLLFALLGPIRARGGYRVPNKGPVLILANHTSDLDPPVVQVVCHRAIHFMAKSELFEMRVIGKLIRWFRAFPVVRGEPDLASLKHAIKLLKAGEVVCVFPEGELSETGELLPLKPGIALIVRQAAAPVICLGIRNTNKVMPYGHLRPRFSGSKVDAEWGEIHEFDRHATTEEILHWATLQLRELTTAPTD